MLSVNGLYRVTRVPGAPRDSGLALFELMEEANGDQIREGIAAYWERVAPDRTYLATRIPRVGYFGRYSDRELELGEWCETDPETAIYGVFEKWYNNTRYSELRISETYSVYPPSRDYSLNPTAPESDWLSLGYGVPPKTNLMMQDGTRYYKELLVRPNLPLDHELPAMVRFERGTLRASRPGRAGPLPEPGDHVIYRQGLPELDGDIPLDLVNGTQLYKLRGQLALLGQRGTALVFKVEEDSRAERVGMLATLIPDAGQWAVGPFARRVRLAL